MHAEYDFECHMEWVHWNTIKNLFLGLGLDPSGLDQFKNSNGR